MRTLAITCQCAIGMKVQTLLLVIGDMLDEPKHWNLALGRLEYDILVEDASYEQ